MYLADSFISIAAVDSTEIAKSKADFVCVGKNDELIIQKAIDECQKTKKNLFFYDGRYYIDDFYDFGDGGPKTAICFPNDCREYVVIGQSLRMNKPNGVHIYVTASALEKCPSDVNANVNDPSRNPYDVIRTTWTKYGLGSGSGLVMQNIVVELSHNRKPIRCIDLRRCDRPDFNKVQCSGCVDMPVGLGKPSREPAVEGCIGITMTDGSNYGFSNFNNCGASGFYEAMQVGGEHVVLINCYTIMNYYGYTFGNYEISCGANHPITLINCMDERNVCLPLFNSCGDSDKQGVRMQGLQEVSMVSFNIEHIDEQSPGGKTKDRMREVFPGTWRGNIDFTIQPAWNHLNEVDFKLWESDGSGSGFKCRNIAHKTVCTTAERLSYYPTLNEQIFDTDLNKLVICIDPDNKVWVDTLGNRV